MSGFAALMTQHASLVSKGVAFDADAMLMHNITHLISIQTHQKAFYFLHALS
jgi:hypothetical protein